MFSPPICPNDAPDRTGQSHDWLAAVEIRNWTDTTLGRTLRWLWRAVRCTDLVRQLPDHPQFDFQPDYRGGTSLLLPICPPKQLAQILTPRQFMICTGAIAASAVTNIHTSSHL